MPGFGQGLADAGSAIASSIKARPGVWGIGAGLGAAVGLPWAYRKLVGMSPEYALKNAPAAQLGGLPPADAKTLQSILIAAGIKRRQLQNVVDFMNEAYVPSMGLK